MESSNKYPGRIMKQLLIVLIICFSIMPACLPPGVYYDEGRESPRIRVGVLENVSGFLFSLDSPVRISDATGTIIGMLESGEWQAQISQSQPAQQVFVLLVQSTKIKTKAFARAEELTKAGHSAVVKTFGRKLTYDSHSIVDNRVYKVFLENMFRTESDAKKYQKKVRNIVQTRLEKDQFGESSGILELKSIPKNNVLRFAHTIRLHDNPITIRDVDSGRGFHWQTKKTQKYAAVIELRIDQAGKITVINDLPIERYLRGVVPAEMPVSFPEEALKAQIIAVRSTVLRKMGVAHPTKAFDVCDDVHCQVYAGISNEQQRINQLVQTTQGIVLMHNQDICNTVYSAVCGGHTEAAHHVWPGDKVAYLPGVLDFKSKKVNSLNTYLTNEKNIRQWILEKPRTFCNLQASQIPVIAEGSKKYFRWQIRYSQQALTDIIQQKTGRKIGLLRQIIPLERGISGRLKSIEIVGTHSRFRINSELKIRQALSSSTLNSACFIVEKDRNGGFLISGAGFGHGVGLCQYGAAGMALSGKNFEEILLHYYPGTKLASIY